MDKLNKSTRKDVDKQKNKYKEQIEQKKAEAWQYIVDGLVKNSKNGKNGWRVIK